VENIKLEGNLKRLFTQSGIVLIIKLMGVVAAFFLNVYLAQQLGVEAYGAYSYVFSWIVILALLSSFGFEHLQVKYIAEHRVKNEIKEIQKLIPQTFLSTFYISSFSIYQLKKPTL
jgi:O-antigen/teichoic acid export membrane protein